MKVLIIHHPDVLVIGAQDGRLIAIDRFEDRWETSYHREQLTERAEDIWASLSMGKIDLQPWPLNTDIELMINDAVLWFCVPHVTRHIHKLSAGATDRDIQNLIYEFLEL